MDVKLVKVGDTVLLNTKDEYALKLLIEVTEIILSNNEVSGNVLHDFFGNWRTRRVTIGRTHFRDCAVKMNIKSLKALKVLFVNDPTITTKKG